MPSIPAADLLIDLAIRYGFQVLGAVVVIVIGASVASWTGKFVDARLQKRGIEPPTRLLFARTARIIVLLFAFVVALDKFGFQIAPLVAGIGVAGLGIGLALQGVLTNVVAGLTIIFTKPFRMGEYIELLGVRGDVATIELFSTTLVHPDRSRIIIPNRRIVGEILHNFGHMRQLHLAVAVSHAADLGRVFAVIHDLTVSNPRVLRDPAPLIGISNITDAQINVGLHPWVRVPDVMVAEAELYQSIIERFRSTGIDMPISYHEIRLTNGRAAASQGQP
jgi:small conductance mechanosensitive channel